MTNLDPIDDLGDGFAERSYRDIRGGIISLRLSPDAELSSPDMARELGVPLASLLRALQQLVQEDLLRERSGVFVVSRIDLVRVLNGHVMRQRYEPRIARIAARTYDTRYDSLFEKNLLRQRRAVDGGDVDALLELMNEFRMLLFLCADALGVLPTVLAATAQLERIRHIGLAESADLGPLSDDYADMYALLRQRKGDELAAIVSAQLHSIFPTLTLLGERHPNMIAGDPGPAGRR